MKHFGNIIIFEKKSEIDYMKRYDNARSAKTIRFKHIIIMFPNKNDFTQAFKNYGESFISMSVEIFNCLFAFVKLLFCWVPYVGIDCVKDEN